MTSVACVLPAFNAGSTIERAIRSVQAQTVRVSEIWVVDDASSDDTVEVVQGLADDDQRIKLVVLPTNCGPARARNIALEAVESNFVAFLDADDAWHSQKVEVQLAIFNDDPEIVIVGSLAEVVLGPANEVRMECGIEELRSQIKRISRTRVLLANPWSTPTVMIRWPCERRFNESQRRSEDYLYWAGLICGGASGVRVNLPLTRLYKPRFGSGGLSADLPAMWRGQLSSLNELRREGSIVASELYILRVWSWIRHIKRMATRSGAM